MILSDEVYDRLYYVPFTRIATLSEEIAAQTLTFGSIGKAFYCTGWRVGYVIGPEYLISHVCTAHTRICYAAPGPQQEAAAVGYEEGDSRGFWEEAKTDMKGKIDRFTGVLDELGLPVGHSEPLSHGKFISKRANVRCRADSIRTPRVGTLCLSIRRKSGSPRTTHSHLMLKAVRETSRCPGGSPRSSVLLPFHPPVMTSN